MKFCRIGFLAISLCAAGEFVEAAQPKPVNLLNRVTTSGSSGAYGFRSTRYNKASWGNRWRQTLGPSQLILSPYVRGR
jgi:hypothetical protein